MNRIIPPSDIPAILEQRDNSPVSATVRIPAGSQSLTGDLDMPQDVMGLVLVGERDEDVLRLHRDAYARLCCERKLEVMPRATHLFEESGTLEIISQLAAKWFQTHLG